MAQTTSTSSNFSAAHVDAYIRKSLLEYGPNKHLLRKMANKEKLPGGMGTVWKVLRSERIFIPTASLTEGSTPVSQAMTISNVTATAVQWGVVVELTDVLMLTIAAPVFQEAIKNVADVMERLDDKLLHDTLLAATNVFFPVSTYTKRGDLTNADVPSTRMLRRIVSSLRLGTTALGAATPLEGKNWAQVIHVKHEMDYQADTTWDQYAARLNAEALESGIINKWEGCNFYSSNFMPEYVDIGNAVAGDGGKPTLTDNVAVTSTVGLNGFKATASGTGGTFVHSTAYFWLVVRKDKFRGIAEGISQGLTLTTGANGSADTLSYSITTPTSTSYVYDLYQGATSATCYLFASNVAAATATSILAPLITGTLAPAQMNTTSSAAPVVYPGYIFGKNAFAVVDLENLQSFVTPMSASDSDPLVQRRKVGAKFFLGSLILQDKYMARFEAASRF